MSKLPITLYRAGAGLAGIRCNSKLRHCAVGIVLLLPGSFVVLPLLWAWRRWAIRVPAAARARAPRSPHVSPG